MTEITIRGNATAEPEFRFTPNGACVANFTVAVNRKRYNKQTGAYEDDGTDFYRVAAWNRGKAKLAENVAESVRKGASVIVTGELVSRTFEKDGQNRTVWEVKASDVGVSLQWDVARVSMQARSDVRPPADSPWATPGTDQPGW